MPGFLADSDLSPNRIEIARRKRLAGGQPLLDFTCGNPTLHGYTFPTQSLQKSSESYLNQRVYSPDPRGLFTARATIANYYARRGPKLEIEPEQIYITAGSSEAYNLLLTLLSEPYDNLLLPAPSYPLIDIFAQIRALEIRNYSLLASKEWSIDYQEVYTLADSRTRAIVMISPHNPTGMVVSTSSDLIKHLGIPLIVDEVFVDLTSSLNSAPSVADLYPEIPVFTINGISKMFALPDLKLGWIFLNRKAQELYGERLALLNDAFLSCSYLVQNLIPDIFEAGNDFLNSMKRDISAKRTLLVQLMRELEEIELVDPQGGSFIFPRIKSIRDEEQLVLDLIEEGVLIHPGYFYAAPEPGYIMLSCLLSESEIRDGIRILKKYLTS